jgi:hypothetical protein
MLGPFEYFPEVVVKGIGEIRASYIEDAVASAKYFLSKSVDPFWIYGSYQKELERIRDSGTWRSEEAASLLFALNNRMVNEYRLAFEIETETVLP